MHNQGLVTLHLKKDCQLCGVRQTGVFIAFGMRVHLSSHKDPFNIQKRNFNETVLDSELQEV